jgi:hypothetical protein
VWEAVWPLSGLGTPCTLICLLVSAVPGGCVASLGAPLWVVLVAVGAEREREKGDFPDITSRAWNCSQGSNVPVVESVIVPNARAFTMKIIKPWWFNYVSGHHIHIQVSAISSPLSMYPRIVAKILAELRGCVPHTRLTCVRLARQVPEIDIIWHPFSIASEPQSNLITIIIEVRSPIHFIIIFYIIFFGCRTRSRRVVATHFDAGALTLSGGLSRSLRRSSGRARLLRCCAPGPLPVSTFAAHLALPLGRRKARSLQPMWW